MVFESEKLLKSLTSKILGGAKIEGRMNLLGKTDNRMGVSPLNLPPPFPEYLVMMLI